MQLITIERGLTELVHSAGVQSHAAQPQIQLFGRFLVALRLNSNVGGSRKLFLLTNGGASQDDANKHQQGLLGNSPRYFSHYGCSSAGC